MTINRLLSYFSRNLTEKSFNKRRFSSSAFSLVEVSIVIMIIGVLVAATISAKALIKNSRIAAAQAKTRAAPINSIPDATIWLESSLEESFSADESEDGSEISGWKDIKSGSAQSENNASSGSGSAPVYSNTINSIQAVKFDKGDDTFFNVNAVNLNNSDYTIFFLEKRQSTGSNYLLGDSDTLSGTGAASENETLVLGYSADGTIIHSQGGLNSYTASVDAYSSSSENPRIITFVQNESTGKKIYINGFLAGQSTNTAQLSNISTLKLGKGYTGEIGEFVVFNRALKGEERKSIEKYLQEKWRMSINSISTDNTSCTKGKTTATAGCDLSEASCDTPSSITGVDTLPSEVDYGSDSIDCDNENYTGTVDYTCTNGVFNTSTSCTPAAPCNSVAIAGIADTGTIAHLGSSSSTCNATGYDSATTLAYTCDNGSLTITSTATSCSCDTNFTGSTCNECETGFEDISTNPDCSACDGAGGYVSDGSGGCRLANDCAAGLTVTGSTLTTTSKAHLETGTLTCNQTGYTGSLTYQCNDGAVSITGSCGCNTGAGYISSGDECLLDECTGGDDIFTSGGNKIHKFTTVGSVDFTCNFAKTAEILLIAGGGAGGNYHAGGGGAGGFLESSGVSITAGTHQVIVGDGGTPGLSGGHTAASADGGDSELNITGGTHYVAYGGGGGNSGASNAGGRDGGSGGGGSDGTPGGGSGVPGQGHDGGTQNSPNNCCSGKGAGGGGAGGAGLSNTVDNATSGGPGKSSDITGIDITYAGGGGGGTNKSLASQRGFGGTGGGGNGGYGASSSTVKPVAGTNGLGGGGGGGGAYSSNDDGARGGSGVVIISYPDP